MTQSYQPIEPAELTPSLVEQPPSGGKLENSPNLDKKDPLYAAIFGSPIGNTKPPAIPSIPAGRSATSYSRFEPGNVDTLDEPVIDTLVRLNYFLAQ